MPDDAVYMIFGGSRVSTPEAVPVTDESDTFATLTEALDEWLRRRNDWTGRFPLWGDGIESDGYIIVLGSEVETFEGWGEGQCLIWESARPYVYLRTTPDRRLIIGGEDDPSDDERRRERRLPQKTERLLQRARAMFPAIPLEVAYAWAGTFGETEDGLAYIGETRDLPGVYFALGYGGNGMTYSVVAAQLIRDAFLGRPNPDAEVFSFDR